ncbi:hypothetical protein [Streptomyces cavernicola]|uniref:Uncharacterized protein n=1 Tax=Streptomyces cavernicola TaxID=3043613 RepID=A0ABT6SEC3_9ACTN|nr:hypothetical protein [Streptomyces sp. B-S-A6]MDI3406533.1 hypothetical protein [Streptomyces sp. B-S-A6]
MGTAAHGGPQRGEDAERQRQLWVDDPVGRPSMPDPVRTAAVRAVIIVAVTLTQGMVALLCTLAGSWLAFPMVLSSVASTVVATWSVLDIWVTRQVWNQRYGVVSSPASTARRLRKERRRARRAARSAARARPAGTATVTTVSAAAGAATAASESGLSRA